MKHGIAEAEWNDYLDGGATPEVRDRIEAHLFGCLECWEFYDRLAGATRNLGAAGEEARQRLTLEDRRLHAMLRGVFAQLQEGAPVGATQTQVQRRLSLLEKVLAPFCGPHAAVRALHAAAQNSPARSLERLTTENWEPFLKKLTAIAAAMCGESFASLVWERGRS